MRSQQTILTAENAVFRYPGAERAAVDGVSLQIAEGEFFAVLGANGSGKSTLAKLFNALYLPTEGEIRVDGLSTKVEENTWDARRTCGMVFQNPDNQLVATVVEEDVAFGLENLGLPTNEIRPRVEWALATVGMLEHAQKAPHMLSGGQKQRVAIAGVLAMRPRAIVFDEATAMLDPAGRKEVLSVVQRLNREEGITVVWITHFMEEAAAANRLAIMAEGKIVREGEPRTVFSDVETIRSLGLDAPEMSVLAASLRRGGAEIPEGILTVEEMVVALCPLLR